MTDGGSASRPGQRKASVPVRPRSAFVAHEVFGQGDGAVLVEPEAARDLRTAAEFASRERQITGGLLYGRRWADDEGQYLVVDGFLETVPGENRDDRISRDGRDSFALSEADLRLLREEAARLYSAAVEVGWWRSLPGPGEFGALDFESQRGLVGPGGAGLLVFGSGLDWGTAYLGPEGRVPDSARSFIPVPRPATEPPRRPASGLELVPAPADLPEPAQETGPEPPQGAEPPLGKDAAPAGAATRPLAAGLEAGPVTAAGPGTSVATRRQQQALAPVTETPGPLVLSPVGVPAREWGGTKLANPSYVGPRTPNDVKVVVGALVVAAVLAAVMIGILLSNVLAAVITGVVLLLGLGGFIWMSRL